MSSDFKQLAFDQGNAETLDLEEKMMTCIKSLAVAVLHTAVHNVCLYEDEQISDERSKAFAARVRGIASNCCLQVPVPSASAACLFPTWRSNLVLQ